MTTHETGPNPSSKTPLIKAQAKTLETVAETVLLHSSSAVFDRNVDNNKLKVVQNITRRLCRTSKN